MAFVLLHLEVPDYDAWKRRFDEDPVGRKQAAKGHLVSRGVDNPNEVFVRTEFASADDARAFRERLLGSGVLDDLTVRTPPTVVERADEATY